MSSQLTDKAIESSKKAEELSSKPILDPQKFVENVKKLKQHFEEIETYRQQVAQQAEAERQVFKQATEELSKIKEVKAKDLDELENTLVGK
jgi:ABC-type transporter Mla subunit MlaD